MDQLTVCEKRQPHSARTACQAAGDESLANDNSEAMRSRKRTRANCYQRRTAHGPLEPGFVPPCCESHSRHNPGGRSLKLSFRTCGPGQQLSLSAEAKKCRS